MNPNNSQAWDRYWKDGRGAACQSGDDGLYTGIIGERWTRLFATLAGGPTRILDLACGNGALARLALQSIPAPGTSIDLHGVDAAAIRPDSGDLPAGPVGCRWYPRTRNEHLPFAARMFDGCVSQYGFEYGDAEASVAELGRVLKPGGWVHWICHWREGDIARDADDEARRARALRRLELPARITRLVELQQKDGAYVSDSHRRTWHLPEAQQVKQGLAEGFSIARSTPRHANGNLGLFLHNLAHLYQHREQQPVQRMLEKMAECDEELLRHQQRLAALVAAALTPERLEHLRGLLRGAGFPLSAEELLREPATGRIVGIELQAGQSQPQHAAENPPATSLSATNWQWSDYWREGAATTFGEGRFEEAYDDAIAEFWSARARDLPAASCIVDMGCGNGAVIALLSDLAARLDRRWTLIGIDSADIGAAPSGALADDNPARVELRGGTPMESTGLADASVDLACGNFGLEYGAPAATAAELARIVKPGGYLAAILHHPQSRVVSQARDNQKAVARLLDQQQFARKVTELVRARFNQDADAIRRCERDVQEILGPLERAGGSAGESAASYPVQVAKHFLAAAEPGAGSLAERLSFIERFAGSLRAWRARMTDMQQATMDDEAFAAWLTTLRDAGFGQIDIDTLYHDNGGLLGRTLSAQRRA